MLPTPPDPHAATAPLPRVPTPGVGTRRVLRLRLSAADLRRCLIRETSDRVLLVLLADPPGAGAAVEVVVVHPTGDEEVVVPGRVLRCAESMAGPSAEVQLGVIDAVTADRLARFLAASPA